jgi:GT2 family glycosyltransferase
MDNLVGFDTLRIPMNTERIAVLVSTHNRHEVLAKCLFQLSVASSYAGVEVDVFLANSGFENYGARVQPDLANLTISEIRLPETFFWASAMRESWLSYQPRRNEFKFLLWLNEDTFLDEDSINRLIREHGEGLEPTVLVGSTRSISGKHTYGGLRRNNWFSPLSLEKVLPSKFPQSCDTFNGNIVFTTPETDLTVGGFLDKYTHLRADLAYGFECRQNSVKVLVASGYYGRCEENANYVLYSDFKKIGIRDRFRIVIKDPKFGPLSEHVRFSLKYGSFMGPLYCLAPIARAALGR